jgi:hypothetical protein
MNSDENKLASELAKSIAALCVRNTFLEDLHSGTSPASQTGDYSDVTVVTPYGEIPWQKLSRISDEEMKRLMTSRKPGGPYAGRALQPRSASEDLSELDRLQLGRMRLLSTSGTHRT